jgi:hypothetical protein
MYDWTYWLDHVTSPSNCFRIVDNGDGTVTITMAGTVMQQGTPQDQTRFNNIEGGIVDAHAASALLLNFARQLGWRVDDLETATVQEVGQKTLTNSETFPFNNSKSSVALANARDNKNYIVVIADVTGTGNVGEIEVTDRLVNGFKLAFTGSAKNVTVTYAVIGGYD